MSFFSWLFNLFHHKKPTPVRPPTPLPQLINPNDYLWEHLSTDTLTARRIDFGHYQISDSIKYDDTHYVGAWSYAPFGPYVAANGDGGEQYVIEGDSVYISCTKDGSSTDVQTFPPHDWLLFKWDANGLFKEVTSGSGKHTRYARQNINFPNLGSVDCLICEHYNRYDTASSTTMERIFLGKGYGRICWQAWAKDGSPVDPARAPDFGWNALDGWVLTDTRVCVNPMTTLPVLGSDLWKP